MSGDQLDLDAKVRRYEDLACPTHGTAACSAVFNGCTFLAYLNRAGEDVRALVAEVRRLREERDELEDEIREAYKRADL